MRRGEHFDLFGHYLIPPDRRGPREQTKHAMRVVLAKGGGEERAIQAEAMQGCDATRPVSERRGEAREGQRELEGGEE